MSNKNKHRDSNNGKRKNVKYYNGHDTYSVGGIVHFAPCWDDKEDWVTDDEDEINEVFYK